MPELPDPEARALLERARGLLPLLRDEAPECERLRAPTDRVIAALRESGVFDMMVPRAYGGLELDLDAFLEVGLTLAEADVSMAWIATFYIEHNWILCQFPEPFQKELFEGRTHVLAPASIAPTGAGVREGDGYRLNGRWRFGTGVVHGTWVMVGGLASDGDATTMRFFAMPREDVGVEDTWHVDGMCGTGSHDIVVEDVFVPAERTLEFAGVLEGRGEGARLHDGPLYHTPMIPILGLAASMPIVGRARAVAREFGDKLSGFQRLGAPQPQSERPAAQMRMARMALEVRQAELLMRDVVRDLMALRDEAALVDRARAMASLCHAAHQARDAVAEISRASGASAHYDPHPLQRTLRDVNMACCHVVFDRDTQNENFGRLLLGQAPAAAIF